MSRKRKAAAAKALTELEQLLVGKYKELKELQASLSTAALPKAKPIVPAVARRTSAAARAPTKALTPEEAKALAKKKLAAAGGIKRHNSILTDRSVFKSKKRRRTATDAPGAPAAEQPEARDPLSPPAGKPGSGDAGAPTPAAPVVSPQPVADHAAAKKSFYGSFVKDAPTAGSAPAPEAAGAGKGTGGKAAPKPAAPVKDDVAAPGLTPPEPLSSQPDKPKEAPEIDPRQENRLFVGHLNEPITSEQLRSAFDEFGEITDVRVVRGKTFAFVSFKSASSTEIAIAKMNGHFLAGNYLRVSAARAKGQQQKEEEEGATAGPAAAAADEGNKPECERGRRMVVYAHFLSPPDEG